ncbi:hypothetical protein THAOC_32068 [Thalassiosira oceanica]|uniref:MYND-type domain-containing protein n=1 Tax=Thalassiosira oceanica TaxID=159749 RepID=K0R6T3_THAOC|nr:hypothetical protein THAOC_32068 [Thalassiosira oceanica]|eukprot:EJK49088.1 hypothetical protein THAOC_32068 [Thalassiosira oceanica]
MSCIPIAAAESAEVCANCGKDGNGNTTVKLKNCTACYLVKYCSVDCQKSHRKQHKKACKERAAALKDEKLYSQGHERAGVDFCPICLLAIPFLVAEHANMRECCMKAVCNGCSLAVLQQGLDDSCPFCRTKPPQNDDEALDMVMKRVAARDPEAIRHLGDLHLNGAYGLEESKSRAFELLTEAAELGSSRALLKMGMAYYNGWGVAQDKAKGIRYSEAAAMRGCAESRHLLGTFEEDNGKFDRAVRHFMISAKMGRKDSLDGIKEMFAKGHATKKQYAEALKGYQDTVEEMKSPRRDEAVASGYGDDLRRSQGFVLSS